MVNHFEDYSWGHLLWKCTHRQNGTGICQRSWAQPQTPTGSLYELPMGILSQKHKAFADGIRKQEGVFSGESHKVEVRGDSRNGDDKQSK